MPSPGSIAKTVVAACASWGAEDCPLASLNAVSKQTDTSTLLQKKSQVAHFREGYEEPREAAKEGLINLLQTTAFDRSNGSSIPSNLFLQASGIDLGVRRNECLQRFSGLDWKLMDALDEPWLVCLEGSELDIRTSFEFLDVGRHDYTFPHMHIEVDPDPNRQRAHIFTMGPESSGTCFVREYVAAALGHAVPKSKHDYTFYPQETAWHISIPEGSLCENEHQAPILDDFGGTDKEFQKSLVEGHLNWRFPQRYILNITSMVRKYRARQEKVIVFQVARNPMVSLLSKKLRKHCGAETISQREQSIAFDILLQAADMQEVTTICYEQMLAEGASYLSDKLSAAGIKGISTASFPAVYNPSTSALEDEDFECTHDVKAYMTLCADSPDAQMFRERCSA